MSRLLALLLLASPLVAAPAAAQGYEDLDGPTSSSGSKKKAKKKKKSKSELASRLEEDVVREVEKGMYLKSGLGSTAYLLRFGNVPGVGPLLRSGTSLALTLGNDFVDTENNSVAWEVSFNQGVHNGMKYSQQRAAGIPPERRIQGDTRTFSLLGLMEYSVYPTRRIGLGVRGGAGLMLAPLLMDKQYAQNDAMSGGDWAVAHQVHSSPHPIVQAGPTLEYYTKLSHFSVGVDVDVSYAIGFDLGAGGQAYLKYTF